MISPNLEYKTGLQDVHYTPETGEALAAETTIAGEGAALST